MKIKVLIPIFCSVFIGFLLGKLIFNQYDLNSLNTFEEGEKIYFIQINRASSLEEIEATQDFNNYLVLQENNIYYLYGGITKNEKIAEKIKDYYGKTSNNVVIQEKNVTNESFLNLVAEYDKITSITTSDKDLISIEKIVISNYKEMILEGNDTEN